MNKRQLGTWDHYYDASDDDDDTTCDCGEPGTREAYAPKCGCDAYMYCEACGEMTVEAFEARHAALRHGGATPAGQTQREGA